MKIFNFTVFLTLGVLGLISISQSSGNNMTPLQNKPYFTIHLDSFGTSFFLELNGINIFSEYDSTGQITTSFPVNQWMRSGINNLEVYILPNKEGEPINKYGQVEAKLLVAPKDQPNKTQFISSIKYSGKGNTPKLSVSQSSPSGQFDSSLQMTSSDDGDVTVFDIKVTDVPEFHGALYFNREINIPSSLPLWAFFKSDELPKYMDMNDDEYYKNIDILLVEYLKVQNAIKSGNIDSILPLFKERNEELDLAFYYPPGTMEQNIKNSLLISSEDSDLELLDLKAEYLNFTSENNNKLTSLTRDGLSNAIVLNYKSHKSNKSYNLIFRKQNGKWILTR